MQHHSSASEFNREALDELHRFLVLVLEDRWPTEAQTFKTLPPELLRHWNETSGAVTNFSHGFDIALDASSVVHVVAGTLAVLDFYWRRREEIHRKEFEHKMQREWERALVAAGLDPQAAKEIPVKYAPEFIKFITTRLITKPIHE